MFAIAAGTGCVPAQRPPLPSPPRLAGVRAAAAPPERGGSRAAPGPRRRPRRPGRSALGGGPRTPPQGDFPLPCPGTHGPGHVRLPTAAGDYRSRDGGLRPGPRPGSGGPGSVPWHGGAAPLQPSRCTLPAVPHRCQPANVSEATGTQLLRALVECPPPRQLRLLEPAPAQSCRQRPVRESPHGGQRLERVLTPGNLFFLFLLLLFPLPAEAWSQLEAPGSGPRDAEPPPPAPPAGPRQPSLPREATCAPSHR